MNTTKKPRNNDVFTHSVYYKDDIQILLPITEIVKKLKDVISQYMQNLFANEKK